MTQGLIKNLTREIAKNKSRFLSIFFIVALGVAFLAGVRAAEPDMLYSIDKYYDNQNFMDIRMISTLGLTRDDVSLVSSVKGVEYAVGGRSSEVYCHFMDNSAQTAKEETRAIKAYEYIGGVNEPVIIEGNVPNELDQCIIDYKIAENYDVKLGDKITLIAPGEDELSDTLSCDTYTVTGIAKSPWYLTYDRGTGSIGNGEIDYFIMIPSGVFVSDVYSEIYIQVEGAGELITGSEEYEELIETVSLRIESLEAEMGDRRVLEVRTQARDKAYSSEDYQKTYEEAYQEAYEEAYITGYNEALDEAKETARQQALEIAKSQAYDEALKKVKEEALKEALDTARETARNEAIETARNEAYETALSQTLEQAKSAAWEQVVEEAYEPALSQVREEAYEKGLEEVNKKVEEVTRNLVKAYCDKNNTYVKEIIDSLDSIPGALGNLQDILVPIDVPEEIPDEQVIFAIILNGLKEAVSGREISEDEQEKVVSEILEKISPDVEKVYSEYFNQQFDGIYKTLFDLQFEEQLKAQYYDEFEKQFQETFDREYRPQFDEEFNKTFNEQYLDTINSKFDETFDSQYAPIVEYQFEKTFAEEYQEQFDKEFEETFNNEYLDTFNEEFEKTFASEYQDEFDRTFKETFEEQYIDIFNEEFDKGFSEEFEKELEEKLQDIKNPSFYILGRGDSVASYIEYKQDAEAIGKIGNVFPLIFFLVAALVALTTMTRMVEDERSQIGTLKALGYSNLTIAGKYIIYTLLAAVLGSIIGCVFGEFVFPFVIMNAYGILFSDIPAYYEPFQWDMAIIASLAAVGTILAATLAACIKSTSDRPASLMRPPAPKAGKRILLEYIGILWKHLSFTAKSSMRNLFRYKKRLFMTVFGIGGCMGLLLVGFGLRDSILTIARYQYREIFVYDTSVSISADAEDEEISDLLNGLENYDGINGFVEIHSQSVDIKAGDKSKNVNLYVPDSTDGMDKYICFRDSMTGQQREFPEEGVAISEKTARILDVAEGDEILIEDNDGNYVPVTISFVFENYVNHYVMMSSESYAGIFGNQPDANMILTSDETRDEDFESSLSAYLMEFKAVSGISLISKLDGNLDDMLSSLDVVIWVLIISAALLAFVVLYNLNNINISERRRELATIKVLGFYNGEVAAYVYRDNIWLTGFGCIAGIFLGKMLHRFIITTVEVDMMMFGTDISLQSFIISIILTIIFSAFVNFIMYFQLKKINMVESLKSVE